MKGKKIAVICMCTVIVAGALFLLANMGLSNAASKIGSDNKGYVTKEVYSHYGQSTTKIAIVTGMHPREKVSKTVVPSVIKSYTLNHNVEIVNYQVNVTDEPEDFNVGRSNGQGLVAKYIIPDINKSNYNLVIICHDHESGYGEGFYIATPTMDTRSVNLGEAVHKSLSQFNYYQRSTDEDAKSSSINQVDKPITSSGTPVFVYEIPEQSTSQQASEMTYKLIDTCFNVINANNP